MATVSKTETMVKRVLSAVVQLGGKAQLQEIYKKLGLEGVEQNYARRAIYTNLTKDNDDAGKFCRVGKKGEGIYELSPHVYMALNPETQTSTLIMQGDGRKLEMVRDSSIDAIVTDHPWKDNKAHRGGNRAFTDEYEETCFAYTKNDIKSKYRVLKEGRFCVEILPRKNASNGKYLREIEELFEEVGFVFFAECEWVKGELTPTRLANGDIGDVLTTFKSNTGRTVKDSERILFFTKGKCRNLRPYKAKIKKVFKKLSSEDKTVGDVLKKILEPGSYEKIKNEKYTKTSIEDIRYAQFSTDLNDILKKTYLQEEFCMSGAKEILPSRFFHPYISPSERIHQAEKPTSLYEEIINLISKEDELILDSFAGGGGVGEGAMKQGRNAILIELVKENIEKIVQRLNAFSISEFFSRKTMTQPINQTNSTNSTTQLSLF
ncbi:MAG: DNA methyltransferase [bacterium]